MVRYSATEKPRTKCFIVSEPAWPLRTSATHPHRRHDGKYFINFASVFFAENHKKNHFSPVRFWHLWYPWMSYQNQSIIYLLSKHIEQTFHLHIFLFGDVFKLLFIFSILNNYRRQEVLRSFVFGGYRIGLISWLVVSFVNIEPLVGGSGALPHHAGTSGQATAGALGQSTGWAKNSKANVLYT